MLVENVYPKLREYCSQRYGVDFQVSFKEQPEQWCPDSIGTCSFESPGLNSNGVRTQRAYVQWSLDSIGICAVETGLNRYMCSGYWT